MLMQLLRVCYLQMLLPPVRRTSCNWRECATRVFSCDQTHKKQVMLMLCVWPVFLLTSCCPAQGGEDAKVTHQAGAGRCARTVRESRKRSEPDPRNASHLLALFECLAKRRR